MENNTVIGNICADPTLRMTKRSGRAMARFTVAVNQRRKIGDELVDRPAVFHRIVCFGHLAENVSNSLRKGMEVLAVGEWVDDSYEDEHGQKHNYVAMEARVIGAGLRWATASVNKVERPARVIPLPGQTQPEPATPDPDPPLPQNDDHDSGEFSANTNPAQPPEPEPDTARATRKGERRGARAS
jgi:single-strand DNA-binding protein